MNRSHYWIYSGLLMLSLGSCGLHSERGNTRKEALATNPIEASSESSWAERGEVLWSARDSEANVAQSEVAQSRAEALPVQDELIGFNADQSDRGLVLTLNGGVLFETDEASLEPGPRITLDRLAAFMQRYPERTLLIEGHTDAAGADQYNIVLSLHRANAVRKSLVARGIEENRIRTIALGENFPVASNDSEEGRQLNRRVEIVLSDEDGQFSPAAQRVAATQ